MEFGLSETQHMLKESLLGLLERHAPLESLHAIVEKGGDEALEKALQDLDLQALMIPEEYGGAGLGMLDAALLQESLGRHAAVFDFLSRSVLAPQAVQEAATPNQKSEWLPKMATGEIRAAAAISEASGARENAKIQEKKGQLSGRALFAMEAQTATHLLTSSDDGRLFLLPKEQKSITITPLKTIDDTRIFSEVLLEGARAEHLAGENAQGKGLARLLAAARILVSADMLGAADRLLEMAVEYAKIRKQFGKRIGSFQAVKHMCAEMVAHLEPARSLLWFVAHDFGENPEAAPLQAALLKAHMAEVTHFVSRTATEVHGGMGFAQESGVHFFFKRIGVNRQLLGGPEYLRAEAARRQGWE